MRHEGDSHQKRARARGQVIVIGVVALIAMLGMGGLILEGGNAYAQQRVTQNAADAAANAGAVVLAERLAGTSRTDANVLNAVTNMATNNQLTAITATYTDVAGAGLGVQVGSGTIPANAQGVAASGSRSFGATIGRVMGFSTFSASADATAVTGRLTGGAFLPIIIPVSIVDCDTNGSLGGAQENAWTLSQPGTPPVGQEYIIPLCKTGGGSFQILDLDPSQRCDDEIANPPTLSWPTLPVTVDSDNGNNCAKPISEYVNANLRGQVVLIPICDNSPPDPCGTTGGSHATYRVIKVAAVYLDYMSDSNNRNNPDCQNHTSSSGQSLVTIAGNGSSSCIAGWFVRYITAGPVGAGTVGNSDAIGIQLIK